MLYKLEKLLDALIKASARGKTNEIYKTYNEIIKMFFKMGGAKNEKQNRNKL